MFRTLIEWIDRCAIEAGAKAVGEGSGAQTNIEAAGILADPGFFLLDHASPPILEHSGDNHFSFPSTIRLGFKKNDVVHGRFWKAKGQAKRAVLLVHGWNAEGQYKHSFPRMAGRLNRLGLAVAAIELPLHSQRRPDEAGAPFNFISDDLRAMLLATKQAINDLHATALWLKQQGYEEVFVWGFSLGSWLAGLLVCFSNAIAGAVLVTPVSRMDKAIDELAFCKPVKNALKLNPFPFEKVNLTVHRPLVPPENILLVQSIYDLFAGEEQVGELWQKWNHPERWQLKHGHISILFSSRQMRRISKWIASLRVRQPHLSPHPLA